MTTLADPDEPRVPRIRHRREYNPIPWEQALANDAVVALRKLAALEPTIDGYTAYVGNALSATEDLVAMLAEEAAERECWRSW